MVKVHTSKSFKFHIDVAFQSTIITIIRSYVYLMITYWQYCLYPTWFDFIIHILWKGIVFKNILLAECGWIRFVRLFQYIFFIYKQIKMQNQMLNKSFETLEMMDTWIKFITYKISDVYIQYIIHIYSLRQPPIHYPS